MRRLPIYFLVDVSESMLGEHLYQLEDGLARIVDELRTDPHALETAWISVIAFAGQVRRLVPLSELTAVTMPALPVGGGTSLGRALNFLMDELDASVRATTMQVKGDWKPIVFLVTDGKPTDDVEPAVRRWRERYAGRVTLVAISIGRTADLRVLNRLTDTDKVLTLDDDSEAGFRRFIAWVTQSVQARTRSVGDPTREERLPQPEPTILTKLNLDKPLDGVDDSFAYFVSRCQKRRLPYVSRFEPARHTVDIGSGQLTTTTYQLVGTYPVKATYFEMSAEQPNVAVVDSDQLNGNPTCPHCGNPHGFAMCTCGNTFCIEGEGMQTCPWCESHSYFGRAAPGSESIDLTRARG